jgi:hypothetical protein
MAAKRLLFRSGAREKVLSGTAAAPGDPPAVPYSQHAQLGTLELGSLSRSRHADFDVGLDHAQDGVARHHSYHLSA